MKKYILSVIEFYNKFSIVSSKKPQLITSEKFDMRFELMREENQEYHDACVNNDLVEVADALGDMLYILCGTIIEHGMQHKIEDVFNEIHRSNMSKLGNDGKPIYRTDGKILKGENYSKPDIESILEPKGLKIELFDKEENFGLTIHTADSIRLNKFFISTSLPSNFPFIACLNVVIYVSHFNSTYSPNCSKP